MKLFSAIASTAVIGISFAVITPAEAYVSPSDKLCNTSSCGMSIAGFADRMQRATGATFTFSNSRDPFCKESYELKGYYSPMKHQIMICNENANSARSIARTISHEVVHAVQVCMNGPVPFGYPGVDLRLTRSESNSVQKNYPRDQYWMEENARGISNWIADKDFIRGANLQIIAANNCGEMKSAFKRHRGNSIRKLH